MATLNKIQLMGRLTAEPEAPRTLPNSGSTVVKFRMAVGRSRKNQQTGQWENDPNPLYIDCEVFAYADAKRNLCDLVSRYVKRGDPLYIEGRLQLDEWDDKNGGGKRSKHKVVVDNIELLGGGGGSDSPAQNGAAPAASSGGKPAKGGKKGGYTPPPDDNDGAGDDIPF